MIGRDLDGESRAEPQAEQGDLLATQFVFHPGNGVVNIGQPGRNPVTIFVGPGGVSRAVKVKTQRVQACPRDSISQMPQASMRVNLFVTDWWTNQDAVSRGARIFGLVQPGEQRFAAA